MNFKLAIKRICTKNNIKVDFRDLGLRFIFGGTSVAFCFILLQLIPSKSFAGVFAAFPAVMTAAIIIEGHFGDSKQASDIALGASAGMLGCALCVLTSNFCMRNLGKWGLSLGIALTVWFFSSYVTIQIIPELLEKLKEKRQQKNKSSIFQKHRIFGSIALPEHFPFALKNRKQ